MYDVIIIGSGPAGLSSAIYASRANLKVLVLEDENFGGKLNKIYKIENYPGFTSILGSELADNLVNHAKSYNIELKASNVKKVEGHKVYTDNEEYEAKCIVVASGVKEKAFDLKNAKDFTNKGISYCAVCDGFFFKNRNVVVVGDDFKAIEDALYLANVANKVYLVSSREKLNSEDKLISELLNNEKIEFINNEKPKSLIIENNKIVGLSLQNRNIECEGIFPHTGISPNTSFLDSSLLDENGFVKVDSNMKTNVPYIYGIGDVINKKLRQVVTACNDGALASTSIISEIKK